MQQTDASEAYSTKKSFTEILSDYAFFIKHSTEMVEDQKQMTLGFRELARGGGVSSFLDFGAGNGEFCELLFRSSPDMIPKNEILLVEPEPTSLAEATRRLNTF